MVSLAFAFSLSASPRAMAACSGLPTTNGNDTLVCNDANSGIDLLPGDDKMTINSGATFSGNVGGNTGNDLIIINGGGTFTNDFNLGNTTASANDTDRMFIFGGTFDGSELQTGAGKNPYVFFMGGSLDGGSVEFRRGSQNGVLVFDGGTMTDSEIEFQTGNATQAIPVDPTVYFRSGFYQGEFEPAGAANITVIFDPVNSQDPATYQALAAAAANGGDSSLSTANLNALIAGAPANPNANHQMIFQVDEMEFAGGNDTVIFNGAVNNGPGFHNLVLQGAGDEITEISGGGGTNQMFVTGKSNLILGEIEDFQTLDVSGGSRLTLSEEEYEFEDAVTVSGASTLALLPEDDDDPTTLTTGALSVSGASTFSMQGSPVELNVDSIAVSGLSTVSLSGSTIEVNAQNVILSGDSLFAVSAPTATLNVDHFELGGASGGKTFKPASYYAAFDPGSMFQIGAAPQAADDDDDDDDDDGASSFLTQVTVKTGASTFVNGGTVNMSNGLAGDRLTINGPYRSFGGNLALDTFVYNKGSATDQLRVNGPVSGTTTIYVNNTNPGSGTFTGKGATDGIQLVSASQALSQNAFQLGVNNVSGLREVTSGAFSYQLAINGNAAYLQSDLLDQIGGYVTAPSVATMHVYAGLETLYQRMGELRTGAAAAARNYDDKSFAQPKAADQFWIRGNFSNYDVEAQKGWDFDSDTNGFLIGYDPSVFVGSGILHYGAFAGYNATDSSVTGRTWDHRTKSDVDVDGWTLGAYATYFQNQAPGTGFYADVVGKIDGLDIDVSNANRHTRASTDATGLTASGEIGYGFNFGGGLTLQPSGQLTFISVDPDGYTETAYALSISSKDAQSTIGRLGLQLEDTMKSASGTDITPYVNFNVLSNFDGDNRTTISGTNLVSDIGGTWYDVGGGVTASWSDRYSVYANLDYKFGDVEGFGGTVGARARW